MKKVLNFLSLFTVIITVILLFTVSANAENANSKTNVSSDVLNTQSNIEEKIADADSTNTVTSSNVCYNEVKEESNSKEDNGELKSALEINNKLFEIYGTWTAVIAAIFILITIISFAIPLYNTKLVDKKIEKSLVEFKRESQKISQRQTIINNALMLSSSNDYSISNSILQRVLEKEQDNVYIHMLMGRNIFFEYETRANDNIGEDDTEKIISGINHFIFVAEHIEPDLEFYELGSIFPNSIIHELCILTEKLLDYSMSKTYSKNYHKLAVRVIKTIEKLLNINDFDDIANEDQTNVFIMNYVGLNHELAKSYKHFKNTKAKEQYEYTLNLYSISSDINYHTQKEECIAALKTL